MWDRSTDQLPFSSTLTGGWICNPGMCPNQESNMGPFSLWDDAATNWSTPAMAALPFKRQSQTLRFKKFKDPHKTKQNTQSWIIGDVCVPHITVIDRGYLLPEEWGWWEATYLEAMHGLSTLGYNKEIRTESRGRLQNQKTL